MEEDLPPGFRFHPTDEEIITHFLLQKVLNIAFSSSTIGEVDLSKCEPWDLPQKAKKGEKEWYFFCQRDRKYPTGMRTNRATEAGYWKATGKDKQIYKSKGCIIGMKKTLVFYKGRAPKGEKTNWVLHEYRLEGNFCYYNLPKFAKDEWVVCRVFQKNNTGVKKSSIPSLWRVNSFGDDFQDFFSSSSYLVDPSYFNSNRPSSSSFIDDEDESQGTRMENQITYFLNEMVEQHQLDHKGSIVSNSSNLSKEMNNSIPTFPNPEYGGQDHAMIRALAATDDTCKVKKQCEVEQFSSTQSMISLSTNIKTKTSLIALEHELRDCLYKDLEGPSSAGAEVDLEYLLDY